MIFGAIMLVLLWLFQVQFLDQFYRVIKTQSVKQATSEIQSNLSTSDYQSSVDEIAMQNDLCVLIVDENQQEIYTSNRGDPRCMIGQFKESEIDSIYNEALAGDGTASRMIETDMNRKQLPGEKEGHGITDSDEPFKWGRGGALQNLTYASVLKLTSDQTVIILVNAEISPVDATVGTIRTQLMIITGILLLVAIALAMLMAKKIGRPIIKINESAKKLATGAYDVEFEGKGYLEIAELNNTLNYAAKELSKVENLRRELIANMSHDLRTPLTMIGGYGEMMRDIPGENTPDNVQIIIDETKRLNNLVNDILDLSKLQAGVQTLTESEFDITLMIQDTIDRIQKMITQQTVDIQFQYETHIHVLADAIKMNQVLYNLINNAMTYCGDDHLILVRQEMQADCVHIEIIDHGQGIETVELPYVWERYYKNTKHHIRADVGTGLGLSIVKSILELHEAQYGVQSEVGKGTTFWITLPIASKS